jgi:hypothetical protein
LPGVVKLPAKFPWFLIIYPVICGTGLAHWSGVPAWHPRLSCFEVYACATKAAIVASAPDNQIHRIARAMDQQKRNLRTLLVQALEGIEVGYFGAIDLHDDIAGPKASPRSRAARDYFSNNHAPRDARLQIEALFMGGCKILQNQAVQPILIGSVGQSGARLGRIARHFFLGHLDG